MNKLTFLTPGSTDPHYALAFEEYIFTRRREGDYLILWQDRPCVIVGKNQDMATEVDLSLVKELCVPVVRRATGGGAVYHDLGNLNWSFITDYPLSAAGPEEDPMRLLSAPVVAALLSLGLSAEFSGRNDILVEGKKVSGCAQRIAGGRILHHGTLLFDTDLALLSRILRPDPAKLSAHGIKSVHSRVGNIRDFLKADMDLEAFGAHLYRSLTAHRPTGRGELTPEEGSAVEALEREKYESPAWDLKV